MIDYNHVKSSLNAIGLLCKIFLIFGLFWVISIPFYIIYGSEKFIENEFLSVLIGVVNLCVTFSLGFLICKYVFIRNYEYINPKAVRLFIYFLFIFYYIVVFIRSYFLDYGERGIFALRLFYSFIFPFWILCPLFYCDEKNKYNIILPMIFCVSESIFWFLFFKTSGSHLYGSGAFVYSLYCTILFVLMFPFLLFFLQKVNILKLLNFLFLKKERIISKIFSWLATILGSVFMILFYFMF